MSLKEQITEDMKTAMRAKDAERLGTIRLLLSAMKQKEVDERIELDDVAVVAIVDKLIKQRKDSITAFEQAARQDLADKEKAEMAVLVRRNGQKSRPRRHGQGHGCSQSATGRQSRHGPSVRCGEGSVGGLMH
jgi:uncharacterized protein YqeY